VAIFEVASIFGCLNDKFWYNDDMKKTLYARMYEPLARLIFKKSKVVTKEPLSDEPSVFLCNHSAAIGPALMTLYFKRPHKTWVIDFAMDKKIGPNYFFHDGLFGRSKKCKGFYRLLSRIIMPLLRRLLTSGGPILVHHDRRIMQTFKESIEALEDGKDLVIFPESPVRATEFVSKLYDGFADVGRMYFQKTGKCLKFYPVYCEKKNRVITIGEPITYDPELPQRDERRTVAEHVQNGIDALARELPPHKPVPFMQPVWYEYYGEYEFNVQEYWKLCNQKRAD